MNVDHSNEEYWCEVDVDDMDDVDDVDDGAVEGDDDTVLSQGFDDASVLSWAMDGAAQNRLQRGPRGRGEGSSSSGSESEISRATRLG